MNQEFKKIIEAVKTPHKYGKLVLVPSYKKENMTAMQLTVHLFLKIQGNFI